MTTPSNRPPANDKVASTEVARQFAELLHQHHRDLFAFIYSLVQHHADAEDVYQQTTLVLWNKFHTFELGTNFGAWATRVADYTARDFLRSRRRLVPCFSEELLDALASAYRPRGPDYSAMRSAALANCLEQLSERDRNLVKRCYARDRDFAAIANEENRTLAAVYQAICRIRKNLYRCVERKLSMESR